MRASVLSLASIVLSSVVACGVDEGSVGEGVIDADSPVLGEVSQRGDQQVGSCPSWACGQNGPVLNNRGFHELAEDGTPNAEGFRLHYMVKGNATYQLRVRGIRLTGVGSTGTLTGAGLIGAFFYVTDADYRVLRVHITDVMQVPLWGGPYLGSPVEAYRFAWSDPQLAPERRVPLCSDPPPARPRSSELLNLPGEFTVVFEHNRYDAAAKTLIPGDANWFNFGCGGHALSKLLLTGHANVSGNATPAMQQAVLKMLTGDYCGNGISFTIGGEPLFWKTSNSYMNFYGQPETLEARWNENGATCLGKPRLYTSANPLAWSLFPNIYRTIAAHCPNAVPPNCSNLDPHNFDGSLVVSGNPQGE